MMGFDRGYGYDSGMMGGGWIGNFLMLLFGLLVVAGIVVLAIWAIRTSISHSASGQGPGSQGGSGPTPHPGEPGHYEAVAIVKRRLAHGEITKDQYDEIMRTLGG